MTQPEFLNEIASKKIKSASVVEITYLFEGKPVNIKLMFSFNGGGMIAISSDERITGNYVVGDNFQRGMPLSGSIPIKDIVNINLIQ